MVSNREDFIQYIRCFNNKDYERQHKFYGDNGSEGIKKHYNFIHELADETLDIKHVLFDQETNPRFIFFENTSWFRFKRDHDSDDPCPGKKGDLCKINCLITYTLNPDQTFHEIRAVSASVGNLGKVDIPAPAPGVIRPS